MALLRAGGRRRGGGLDAWPGYVDALSTLLMVVTFVLLVFVLAQGFLSVSVSSRDAAMERLQRQVEELNEAFAVEQGQSAELRALLDRAAEEARGAASARDRLAEQARALSEERARALAERDGARAEQVRASARLADLEAAARAGAQRLSGAEGQLADTLARAEAASREAAAALQRLNAESQTRARAEAALAEERGARQAGERNLAEARGALETARLELAALRRQQLEAAGDLAEARRQIDALRAAEAAMDRVVRADRATLEIRLSEIARLEREVAALQSLRDEAARGAAAQERRASGAEAQAALLGRQLEELRGQLARLNAALGDAEGREREGEAERRNLQARLAVALAQRVEELTRYRSEFFGRVRAALGDRPEVRVQGDRFVFQSEVLFPPGGAELSVAGREQLRETARVLGEIARAIPPEIPWVLRVDGHADRQPVRPGARFATNWELSAARAIAVANLMIESGIPANRVAAAAFGEHQPLDPADTPEAFARNRRIELRLTDR